MRWPGHRLVLGLFVAVLAIWTAAMAFTLRRAALPAGAAGPLLAVFEIGTSEDDIFAAIIAAGGKPLRPTWLPFVWTVAGDEPGLAGRLEAAGAAGTYRELPVTPSLAGCFAYADTKLAALFELRP